MDATWTGSSSSESIDVKELMVSGDGGPGNGTMGGVGGADRVGTGPSEP